jgi:multidrug efflux pump subunit AcrA (membrane-fusion protein)
MTRTNNKYYKILGIFIVLIIATLIVYKYGSSIPLINKIPIFTDDHEHEYRPVFTEEGEIDYWTCAMHPSVRLKEPGQCPICGMETTPVWKDNSQTETVAQAKTEEKDSTKKGEDMDGEDMSGMQGHDHSTMGVRAKPGSGEEAKSTFSVSPERQQLIGVKTEPVMVRFLDKEIRTVGIVEIDETRIENVNTKIKGWIDKVFIDYTWEYVKKGDPLFSIYSPELVSTQEEFLLALKSKELLGSNKYSEIASGSNSLLQSTRRRLELWDISENQIRELERTGKVKTSLTILSPVSGNVVEKNAFENMFVVPNTTIYIIADHSIVWVQVDIYENEIPLIKLGQQATMTLASFPGEEFSGKATFIWPHIDPKTRTVKVRLEFPNPDFKLLPEMYANVNLEIPIGEKLSIPESAVLRTGKQDIVFVDKGEGNMAMREVELGQKAGGYYEVLRGLKNGDNVVSRANFLIDSESKNQAAVATWGEESESDQDTKQKSELRLEQETDDNSATQQPQLHQH